MALKSGIPIGEEYCEDIDKIKEELYTELVKIEGGSKSWS